MRILLIKISSMGDVIHALPAVADAGKKIPTIRIDWVVEKAFAEIPAWSQYVDEVIPISLRKWKKHWLERETWHDFKQFLNKIRSKKYDLIIDAQGLLKTALLSFLAKGRTCGYDTRSARESIAAIFYRQKLSVSRDQHAIFRIRSLFSQALQYDLPQALPDYGLHPFEKIERKIHQPYFVFLHSTTWDTKHWPETHWIQLGKMMNEQGYAIVLPWGNDKEKGRAERIASACLNAIVLPKCSLSEIRDYLLQAVGAITVDTGLGHLAVALNVPTIALFGPTKIALTGMFGSQQYSLSSNIACSPCFSKNCIYQESKQTETHSYPSCLEKILPSQVWEVILKKFFNRD